MADPLWMKLRAEDWASYDISAKEAKKVPKLLEALASKKEVRAMKASQQLWTILKPGSTIAKSTIPFLEEIKLISTRSVTQEIEELERRAKG